MTTVAKNPIILDDFGTAIKLESKDGSAVSLTNVHVGAGWDVGTSTDVDIDIHIAFVDSTKSNKLVRQADGQFEVYYGSKQSACGSVVLDKDNRTGAGDGYDENVQINLETIPANINVLPVIIDIYDAASRKQTFGRVRNAFVDVNIPGLESIRADLTEDYPAATTIHVANIYRLDDGVWKVKKIGEASNQGVRELLISML